MSSGGESWAAALQQLTSGHAWPSPSSHAQLHTPEVGTDVRTDERVPKPTKGVELLVLYIPLWALLTSAYAMLLN